MKLARSLFLIPVVLVAAAAAIMGQKQGTVNEFDPGISVTFDLDRRVRLDFNTGKEKSEEAQSSKWKISGGVSVRLKSRFKRFLDAIDSDKQHLVVVGTAYEYSIANDTGGTKIEHKIMLDATPRYAFGAKLLMSDRNRLEFRWINGVYHWRYRNRLLFERPIKIAKLKLAPYGGAEPFWDSRYDKWSMFKFIGGVNFPFIRRSTMDVFYERQHCVTCSDPQTNILGITLNVAFGVKK